jgi:hypothetical protein
MTERPILFSKPMVQAILAERKSMTRRVIKDQPIEMDKIYYKDFKRDASGCHCPYGQVGDVLYVKETHYRFGHWIKNGLTKTGRQKWLFKPNDNEVRFMDNPPTVNVHKLGEKDAVGWFKRSSLFLPHKLARLHLEITNIRVERLQEITDNDCIDEGVTETDFYYEAEHYSIGGSPLQGGSIEKCAFIGLWNSINSKTHPWESNPWCWVNEFKKV